MVEEIELDVHPDAVNTAFWPYLNSRARFRLFWGGRDSSKSDFVALDLLLQCLALPYFKCVLVRDVFNTIGGSMVATLRKVAERENIDHLFTWGVSPLGVKCLLNGNTFVPHGMDNPGKLKSLSDPTHAWYEEANQIAQADADVLSSSLRSSAPGAILQEIYTFNPDHEGDYKTFWLWQKFFRDTGHPEELSFSGRLGVSVDGELIEMLFEVLHSTADDNRWCPPERKALYRSYEFTDPYRYRVWWLGLWATRQTGNEFYPMFSRATHAAQPVPYLPGKRIFQSWDANSLPYCAMLCCQPDDQRGSGGKLTLRFFQEYAIGPPNNGIASTGLQFLLDRQRLQWEESAVSLTGDATMRNNKIGERRGESTQNDVVAALMNTKTVDGQTVPGCLAYDSLQLWPKQNPGVDRRRAFLNYVLAGGYHDVAIQLDPALALAIEDLELTQKGIDGKLKEKYHDPVLNVTYEKRGHFSDVFDYACCTILAPQYEQFTAKK